jgi:hypothetical protein
VLSDCCRGRCGQVELSECGSDLTSDECLDFTSYRVFFLVSSEVQLQRFGEEDFFPVWVIDTNHSRPRWPSSGDRRLPDFGFQHTLSGQVLAKFWSRCKGPQIIEVCCFYSGVSGRQPGHEVTTHWVCKLSVCFD